MCNSVVFLRARFAPERKKYGLILFQIHQFATRLAIELREKAISEQQQQRNKQKTHPEKEKILLAFCSVCPS